jgi:hypothetical protein
MESNQHDSTIPRGPANDRNGHHPEKRTGNGRHPGSNGDRWYHKQQTRNATMSSLRGELAGKTMYLQRERKNNDKLREENRRLQNDVRKLEEEYGKLMNEKNDKLREESLRLQNDRQKQQEEHDKLMNEKKYARSRYDYLLQKLVLPYARERNLHWDDRNADSISVTLQPLIADVTQAKQVRQQLLSSKDEMQALQDQVKGLQAQVQSLQTEMLARVDKVVAVSDDQFNQDFRALAALVKSLSRSVRVTEDMNIFGIIRPHYLHKHVAEHQWANRARKKYYIEAWIWSILYQRIFSNPFAILGRIGEEFGDTWECLFGDDFVDRWPVPSSLCENWRCIGIERMVDQVGRSTIMEGLAGTPPGSEAVQSLRDQVTKTRSATCDIIGSKIVLVSTTVDLTRVPLIVNKAYSLAMEMSLQRSRLQVTWPYVGELFVKEEMSCVPDSDGEEFEAGTVAFTVHPGLVKWGDANGKNFEERYDIVSSLVHLELPVRRATAGVIKQE